MICTVACQEIELVRLLDSFHPYLILNFVHRKAIHQKTIIRFGVPGFQNKRQISYRHGNYFLHL